MAIIGSQVDSEFINIDTFTGDGSTVTFGPLTLSVETASQVGVHNNGYYQIPTIDYTVNQNQITFNQIPSVGNTIVVLHLGKGVVPMEDLADNSISSGSFSDLSVTGVKLAENNVSAVGTFDNSILFLGNNITDNTITGNLIVANTITGNLLPGYINVQIDSVDTFANVLSFSTQGIRFPTTTNLDFGSGDFTIEFWMKANTSQAYYATITDGTPDNAATIIAIGSGAGFTSSKLNFTAQGGVATALTSTTTVTDNVWRHIACVKSGSNGYLFINGALEATTTGWSGVTAATLSDGQLGRSRYDTGTASDNIYSGYISNFRILKGTALYTSGFTVSNTPTLLTAITDTQLLISSASTTIADTSNNAFTLTPKNIFPTVIDDTIYTYSYDYANVQNNAINSDIIALGAITGNLIATNSIRANQIVAGAITGNLIATNSIRANQIVAGAITSDKIQANSLTANVFSTSQKIPMVAFDANSFLSIMPPNYSGISQKQAFFRNGTYTVTFPSDTKTLKITAVGGGGGGGGVISAWTDPTHPTANNTNSPYFNYGGISGQGGGGAGFVMFVKGPFPSNTFNITIGAGGAGGSVTTPPGGIYWQSNTVSHGVPGGATRLWGLMTVNSNISVTANGGYGSNAYNALAIGVPGTVTTVRSQPYPVYGSGGKGGIAGETNVSSDFVIFHHAGFDGNVASQINPYYFPGMYYYRCYVQPNLAPAAPYPQTSGKLEFEMADYNPQASQTILGTVGAGAEMIAYEGGGFYPAGTPQTAFYWSGGRGGSYPGTDGGMIIEY